MHDLSDSNEAIAASGKIPVDKAVFDEFIKKQTQAFADAIQKAVQEAIDTFNTWAYAPSLCMEFGGEEVRIPRNTKFKCFYLLGTVHDSDTGKDCGKHLMLTRCLLPPDPEPNTFLYVVPLEGKRAGQYFLMWDLPAHIMEGSEVTEACLIGLRAFKDGTLQQECNRIRDITLNRLLKGLK